MSRGKSKNLHFSSVSLLQRSMNGFISFEISSSGVMPFSCETSDVISPLRRSSASLIALGIILVFAASHLLDSE